MKFNQIILIILAIALVLVISFFAYQQKKIIISRVKDAPVQTKTENSLNQDNKPQQTPQPVQSTTTPAEIVWANKNIKQVVFTFDAGAGTQSLDTILSILKKYNLKATFFLTGKWAEKNPEGTKKIAMAGHEIFNHTYSHPYLSKISDEQIIEELTKTATIITSLTGQTTKPYFRPPYGDRNQQVRDIAASIGYQSVYWTIDAWDWRESEGVSASQVKARILDNLKPGTIYLMHIGDNITGQILDDIFSQILAQGYQINPLSIGVK